MSKMYLLNIRKNTLRYFTASAHVLPLSILVDTTDEVYKTIPDTTVQCRLALCRYQNEGKQRPVSLVEVIKFAHVPINFDNLKGGSSKQYRLIHEALVSLLKKWDRCAIKDIGNGITPYYYIEVDVVRYPCQLSQDDIVTIIDTDDTITYFKQRIFNLRDLYSDVVTQQCCASYTYSDGTILNHHNQR